MTPHCRSLVTAVLALGSTGMLAACSSSTSVNPPTDAGHDASHDATAADATPTESGAKDVNSNEGHADSPASDAGGPITGLATETWTWVPFPESKCRDGSSTGIGVNYNPASNNVMIFLEGGGACFNIGTCVLDMNPSSFDESDFTMRATSSEDEFGLNVGILDRTQAANPVRDWSYVYVPYCTGDVHAGNNPAGKVPDVGTENFAGYTNMQQYLSRIAPTFPKASQVLFAGMSAGGFGAAADYELAATAFGSVPVTMLDDSGPFMEDPYFASCLVTLTTSLWGLDKTLFATCGSACSSPSNAFVQYASNVVAKYPNVAFGLADSIDDGTISEFFGFGYEDCASFQQLSPSVYGAGLYDIRTKLSSATNFGTFYFPGTIHTTTQSAAFYTRTSGGGADGGADGGDAGGDGGAGVFMTDWVAALLAGHASNVGP
jgi:hypothetical protein